MSVYKVHGRKLGTGECSQDSVGTVSSARVGGGRARCCCGRSRGDRPDCSSHDSSRLHWKGKSLVEECLRVLKIDPVVLVNCTVSSDFSLFPGSCAGLGMATRG